MSYGNQAVHRQLDRALIIPLLEELAAATVAVSPTPDPRPVHLARLRRLSTYRSEQAWLDFAEEHDLRLPDGAQERVADAAACPDFVYRDARIAVFVDGGVHGYADVAELDRATEDRLMDAGWIVARFRTSERSAWLQRVKTFGSAMGVVDAG